MPRPSQGLSDKPVATKLDGEVLEALQDFAEKNTGGNISEAMRLLLSEALRSKGQLKGLSRSLEDEGRLEGRRQGIYEVRQKVAAALNELWQDSPL